jgi:hypothetical protein
MGCHTLLKVFGFLDGGVILNGISSISDVPQIALIIGTNSISYGLKRFISVILKLVNTISVDFPS